MRHACAEQIAALEAQMAQASSRGDFERCIALRAQIAALQGRR